MKFNAFIATGFLCLSSVAHGQVIDTSAQWTFIKGTTVLTNRGVFTTVGVEGATHNPSSRRSHATWTDTAGNLWLFGGVFNTLNNWFSDLWRYNMSTGNWMWVKGGYASTDAAFRQVGVYGTRKTEAPANLPGGRLAMVSWKDSKGKFWLFGGRGTATNTALNGTLNDLWRFDPATTGWTWISGTSTLNDVGRYGTKGVPSADNRPSARGSSENAFGAGWEDNQGDIWIFGGDSTTNKLRNDLWRYNLTTDMWTWMGGDSTTNAPGVYGQLGVEAPTNYPGARSGSVRWKDAAGDFWLFGGYGIDASGTLGPLNDLWRFKPSTNRWTWMHGTSAVSTKGVYGTRGVAAAANMPGGRYSSHNGDPLVDVQGKLWLYGGYGLGDVTVANLGYLQDLWAYDPATNQWTWMRGSGTLVANTATQPNTYPVYGTTGTPGPNNHPGCRSLSSVWVDKSGNFWLFGGIAYMSGGGQYANAKNDLFRLAPIAPVTPAQPGVFTVAKPSVCGGESNVVYTVPSVGGATSYEWLYTGTGVTFSATTVTPTNSLSFSATATGGKLSVRAINAAGNGPYRDTIITVNALPVAVSTNTGARAICQGDSLQLSATVGSGVSYQWKNGASNVGTGPTYQAKTSGTYTVTVTNTTTNCSATSSPVTTLTVNPLPTVTVTPTGNQTICAGDSLNLTSATSGNVSYEWRNGALPVGTASNHYAKVNGGVYTLMVKDLTTNCVAISTPATTLTVNPLPVVTVTNTGAQVICQGDSMLLTATSSGNMNFQWLLGNIPVGTGQTYSATVAGSYTVRVTDPNTNCSVVSALPTVLTVNSLPTTTLSAAGGQTVICSGDSVILTAAAGASYTYQWMDGQTNLGAGGNTYTARVSGEFSALVTDGTSGCKGMTPIIPVVVHSKPVATLTPSDTAFCEGGVATLRVQTLDTGLTYTWYDGAALVPMAFASFLEIDESGTYRVIVGRSFLSNCKDSTNPATITVHPLPVVSVSWDGEVFQATPGFASYQWITARQPIVGATLPTFQPVEKGDYTVVVTDTNGCSTTSSIQRVSVGLEDLTAMVQVMVTPNPTTGLIRISSAVPVNAVLSNMGGQILESRTNVQELDLSKYAQGLYLLRLTDQQGVPIKYEKLIKR